MSQLQPIKPLVDSKLKEKVKKAIDDSLKMSRDICKAELWPNHCMIGKKTHETLRSSLCSMDVQSDFHVEPSSCIKGKKDLGEDYSLLITDGEEREEDVEFNSQFMELLKNLKEFDAIGTASPMFSVDMQNDFVIDKPLTEEEELERAFVW